MYIKKEVLVVEDDPTYSKLWERILKGVGVKHFHICKTAEEAHQWAAKKKPDLLISDVLLPDNNNGYRLAQELRRKNHGMTVLLTTGYKTDLRRFDLKNPSFHLLYKPYHQLRQLQIFLEHLLAGEDPSSDAPEDTFSENEDYPEVTEWNL